MPAEPGPAERARLAAEALARAREDARARGEGLPMLGRGVRQPASQEKGPVPEGPAPPQAAAGTPVAGGPPSAAAGQARASGPASPGRRRRTRRDDPETLRSAIGGLLDERGWRGDLAVGGVFGRWDQIVGPELAAHTRPASFAAGELTVTADSTAWATQLRLLAGTLVARINTELGGNVVRRVKVRGPAPPPRPGPWRVRGGRGPRGDYG